MSDDAPLILSKADLKAEHREIYNNILRENGGESAFGAVDLDRIATIAKLQQDLRNDKLEPMERVKIVEAIDRLWARLPIKPKQFAGAPLHSIPENATLKEAHDIYQQLLQDGKVVIVGQRGNKGFDKSARPFKYDYSQGQQPSTVSDQEKQEIEQKLERDRVYVKTRLQQHQRLGGRITEQLINDALFAMKMGQEELERFLRQDCEEVNFDPTPITIDVTPTPVLGNEPAIICPSPRKVQRIPSKRQSPREPDQDPEPAQEGPAKRPPVDLAPFKQRLRKGDASVWEEAANVLNYDRYDELNKWVEQENEWIEIDNRKIRERREEEARERREQAYLETMPEQEAQIADSYARQRAKHRRTGVFMTRGNER